MLCVEDHNFIREFLRTVLSHSSPVQEGWIASDFVLAFTCDEKKEMERLVEEL